MARFFAPSQPIPQAPRGDRVVVQSSDRVQDGVAVPTSPEYTCAEEIMRTRLFPLLLLSLLILSGCGGIRLLGIVDSGAPFFWNWNAQIIQPATTTIILAPGSSVIVIVEFVPIGGVFFTGSQFVNAFNGANPNLIFCPSVINIVNDGLFTPNQFSNPSIGLTLLPIGRGLCSIPLNLGQSGTVVLNVSVN